MARFVFPSVRLIVMSFIRFVLLLGIVTAFIYNRDLFLFLSMVGFAFTFIPLMARLFFKIEIPAQFEIIVLLFLYGVFIFAETWGFYAGFFWIRMLFNFGAGIFLGFVGLSIIHALEDEELLELTPFVIVFFTFCFAFSIGSLWEIFEYVIDTFFHFSLQRGSLDETMLDLLLNAVSALFVSLLGFYNYRRGNKLFSNLLFMTVKRNSRLFGKKRNKEYYARQIDKIIQVGEGEKVEFKSTFRKNLHTNEIDKKMEHSVLKTITGFLNAKGGILLVGVSDDGGVLGLSNDDFPSHDKFRIYVTGLLRSHLGNQYLSHIRFNVYEYKGKEILKINCSPSRKRVFLKWGGNEEFYVRHGASTLQLHGSALLDYVSERFS